MSLLFNIERELKERRRVFPRDSPITGAAATRKAICNSRKFIKEIEARDDGRPIRSRTERFYRADLSEERKSVYTYIYTATRIRAFRSTKSAKNLELVIRT